jgi:hypothetical protein
MIQNVSGSTKERIGKEKREIDEETSKIWIKTLPVPK